MPFRHFYLLSHYICNGLFVLFSVCWLHVNEFNSLCGDKGGEVRSLLLAPKLSLSGIFIDLVSHGMKVIVFGKDQKVMTYSDTVNADKIISSAIIVYDKFTTILWQYIILLFWMVYLSSKQ